MTERNLLIGDIGGTNARFALANRHYPGFHDVVEVQCSDFDTSGDAIRHYLERVGVDSLGAICLAAAGPVVDLHAVRSGHGGRVRARRAGDR